MKQNLLFKLSYLMSNFALTPSFKQPNPDMRLIYHRKFNWVEGLIRLRKQTDILSQSDYQNHISGQ